MIELTEPQVWTLIGVFAAALVGMITFTTQVMWGAIASQISSLREEMKIEFASVRTETAAQFDSVRSEIASVRAESSAQFESMRTQIAHLDRDVQAISRKVFPEP